MQRKILLFGAGKSASYLIDFFVQQENYLLSMVDPAGEQVLNRYPGNERLQLLEVNINESAQVLEAMKQHDLVISMLPAAMHPLIARYCLQAEKSLFTASYVSEEMRSLDAEAKSKGLLFMNEVGLDPGIDHMSALLLLDTLRKDGAKITGFYSYTGGLIAPESDTNPWHYKFTWNPRNVVLAAQGGLAQLKENGRYRFLSYNQVFRQIKQFDLGDWGRFEGYANRDSLAYRSLYGLEDAETMIRGTLRGEHFCSGWDFLVQLGLTENHTVIHFDQEPGAAEFLESFLPGHGSMQEKIQTYLGDNTTNSLMSQLAQLGLYDNQYRFKRKSGTPAEFLQELLEDKWKLEAHDKDMIVMLHRVNYHLNGKTRTVESRLRVIGHDQTFTAMAQTVGLPLAYAAEAYLNGAYHASGVHVPNDPALYAYILQRLSSDGIVFEEHEISHL
ncbi:MAG: saccharopine dehydrogenase [Bacteroidetes bacterium]|nr:MAG: saccharopine dehydrogenase [Bacteroidota bacterium]